MIYYSKYPYKLELSLKRIHCIVFCPKYPHNAYIIPQKAYISIVFDEKYPIIAYIILDLELKYPLIAYIILGLKKVQNIFKPDNSLGGSTYRIHFVLRPFVDMANSYDQHQWQ